MIATLWRGHKTHDQLRNEPLMMLRYLSPNCTVIDKNMNVCPRADWMWKSTLQLHQDLDQTSIKLSVAPYLIISRSENDVISCTLAAYGTKIKRATDARTEHSYLFAYKLRLLASFANRLDPNQARGAWPGSNLFCTLVISLQYFFEKVYFGEKKINRRLQKHKKYPACKSLN